MKFYAVDIETYEQKGDFLEMTLDTNKYKIGGIINEKYETSLYKTPEELWNHIERISKENKKNKEKTYIFAHYHEYDFYGYAKHIMKEKITNEELIIPTINPFIGILNKNTYFVDTLSFFPMTLKQVGKLIGLEKKEPPKKIKDIEEAIPYLQRDLEITIKAVHKIREMYKEMGYNPRKLITAPSTAMSCFITYITRKEKSGWLLRQGAFHKNPETINKIRQANRGGRNEAFQLGKFKKLVQIDINSHYWKAMTDMEFPDLVKEKELNKETIEQIGIENVIERTGVTRCTIKVPITDLGLLGTRYRPSGESKYKQFFPHNGEEVTGTWTNIELKKALEEGYQILETEWSIIWEQNLEFNRLKEFITDLWEFRKKNKDNKLKNYFAKLTGNGLYGKFIQKRKEKEYKWINRAKIQEWTEKGWQIESAEGEEYCISREREEYIPRYLSIILGTYITAIARIRLYDDLKKIPLEKRIYVDTDSIITTKDQLKKFEIGDELGQYKIEAQGKARISGEKKYYIGENVKVAGLRKDQQTKEILDKELTITTKRIIGLKQGIHFYDFNRIGSFEEINKEFKTEAKNRFVLPDKYTEEDM